MPAPAKKHDDKPPPALPSYLSVVQPLGKGAYGDVFLCNDSRDSTQVAVKRVRDFARDPLFGKRVLREIRILAALRHQNLLKLVDLLPVPSPEFDDVYIVMPYMHLDLHKVIYSKMKLSESHVQAFACQILRGLKYLHSAGVAHRDLKPSNILVNKDCTLRIADLGLARGRTSADEELTDYVVTRWYRAPELMLLPSGYFEAVDLWSVGCIHVEVLSRKPLFPGENHVDMLRRIATVLGFSRDRDLAWLPAEGTLREGALNFVDTLGLVETHSNPKEDPLRARMPDASDACLEFVHELLTYNPRTRISAANALSHKYLVDLADPPAETTAPRAFAWDFEDFEPTKKALREKVYAECARYHPEIVSRDAEWHAAHSNSSRRGLTATSQKAHAAAAGMPLGPPPARLPRSQSSRVESQV